MPTDMNRSAIQCLLLAEKAVGDLRIAADCLIDNATRDSNVHISQGTAKHQKKERDRAQTVRPEQKHLDRQVIRANSIQKSAIKSDRMSQVLKQL
jgi:hypothetical protein